MKINGFLLILFLLASCGRNNWYEKYQVIENCTWNREEVLEYSMESFDTLRRNDIYIHIRNNQNYPMANLLLEVKMIFPVGDTLSRKLSCRLTDDGYRWQGKGETGIKDCAFLWRNDFVFPQTGHYQILIKQAMSAPKIEGICAVGISIGQVCER